METENNKPDLKPTQSHAYNKFVIWAVFLLISTSVTYFVVNRIKHLFDEGVISFNTSRAVVGPSLAVSPTSFNATGIGQTFTVNIVMDTAGIAVDGVDLNAVRFNPAILQVVDSDSTLTGTQIGKGVLLPNTNINTVNNTTGVIQFSQTSSGGGSYTGSGTLATITFQTLAAGTSAVTFDYTAGSGADCNLSSPTSVGTDVLAGVTNGSYTVTVDTTPPTISSVTASGVTGSAATITWTTNEASDSQVDYGTTTAYGTSTTLATTMVTAHSQGLSGLAGSTLYHYRVKSKDAAGNLATSTDFTFTTTDTTPPVISAVASSAITTGGATITWTTNEASDSQVEYGTTTSYGSLTTLAAALVTAHSQALSGLNPGTLYHFRVKSKDAAGNLANSADSSFTTSAIQLQITMDPEAHTSKVLTGTMSILNSTKALLVSMPFTTNASGQVTLTLNVAPQTVYLKFAVSPFLVRVVSGIDLTAASPIAVTVPKLLIGDINQDNIINSIDYSSLNGAWFTADAVSDLNQDGLVNTLDWSWMNSHWLVTGEQ